MAACPETGETTALVLPSANTDCMNIFLQQLSQDYSEYQIILQVDGAAWHKSKGLNAPKNIHLIFQPPYSPELNPMEAVWDYIKENFFRNRLFSSMNELFDALCLIVRNFQKDKARVHSITDYPFIKNAYSNAI